MLNIHNLNYKDNLNSNTLRRYFYLLFFFSIYFFVSCSKKFLDVEDKSAILRQDYVIDLKNTGVYLNGVYVVVATNFYSSLNQVYPDLAADNIKPITANLNPHYNWSQSAYNASNMDGMWRFGYQIIRSCNFVIEKAGEFRVENISQADDMMGQAYALRALIHFTLVNTFAQTYNLTSDASHTGIPYVITSDWTHPETSRKTVNAVYTELVNDLNKAVQLMPADPTNTSVANKTLVMNKMAAKALLARVHLFKGDYQIAKNIACEIAKLKPLMTINEGYPSDMFKLLQPTKVNESLFQLAPAAININGGTYTTVFQGRYFVGTGSQVQFLASTDIATLFKQSPTDIRKNWIRSGGIGKDTITKYPVNVVTGFNPTSLSYYPTILRSSEMYLTAAEAYAKLNNLDSATYYINAIRKRADPSSPALAVSGTALLDSIFLERRKELAFEGIRMFDLQRWNQSVTRTDAPANSKNLPFPSNKAISPIPLLDVQISGLAQNTDY